MTSTRPGSTQATSLDSELEEMARARCGHVLDVLARFVRPPAALLDIGCGSGILLEVARTRRYEVSGVEPRPAALDQARARLGSAVPLIQSRGEELPDPETPPRVITLCDIFEHVATPRLLLRRCRNVLPPGGWVVLVLPIVSWQALAFHRVGSLQLRPDHIAHYDRRQLRRLLTECGFRVVLDQPALRGVCLSYLSRAPENGAIPALAPWIRRAARLFPPELQRRIFLVPSGERLIIARAAS